MIDEANFDAYSFPLTEQIRMQNGEIEPERSEGYPKSYVDTTSGEINPLCAETRAPKKVVALACLFGKEEEQQNE